MPDVFDQLEAPSTGDIFDQLGEPEEPQVMQGLVQPTPRRFSMYDVPALAEKLSESPLPTYGMDVPTVSIPVALAKTVAGLGRGVVSPLGAAATALGPVEAAGPALKAGFGALGIKGLAEVAAQQITTPEARPKTIPQAVELAGQVLPQLAMAGAPLLHAPILEVPREFRRPVEPLKPIPQAPKVAQAQEEVIRNLVARQSKILSEGGTLSIDPDVVKEIHAAYGKDWRRGLSEYIKAVESAQEKPPEVVTAATYTNPETGETTTGPNHPAAAAEQGVKAPEAREARETPEYGFQVEQPTGKTEVVSRDTAEEVARQSGQLKEEPKGEKVHSDEILSPTEPGKTISEQKETPSAAEDPLAVMKQAMQKLEPDVREAFRKWGKGEELTKAEDDLMDLVARENPELHEKLMDIHQWEALSNVMKEEVAGEEWKGGIEPTPENIKKALQPETPPLTEKQLNRLRGKLKRAKAEGFFDQPEKPAEPATPTQKPMFRFLPRLPDLSGKVGDVWSAEGERLTDKPITPEEARKLVAEKGGELIHGAILGGAEEAAKISRETGIPLEQKQLPPSVVGALSPAESTHLKSLTDKLESGKPLTSAEQKRFRALKDKVSPPEGEKPEVEAAGQPARTRSKFDPLIAKAIFSNKIPDEAMGWDVIEAVPTTVLRGSGESTSYHPYLTIRVNGKQVWRGTPPDVENQLPLKNLGELVPVGKQGKAQVYVRKPTAPPTTPPSTGEGMRGGELQMAIVPGLKEFVEQDLVPFAKKVGQTIGETAQQMKAMAAPPTMGPEASLAAGIVREHKGKLAQTDVQMREKFHKNLKDFDGMSPQASLAFIDRMERGGVQPSTPLHQLQSELRTEFDRRVAQVRALGTGKLQHLIQDYFPHIWKDPDAAVSWYARILGKRPLKGPASFLKRRTIPLTVDGVQAGLEPVSWNPVELSLLKFHEMDRYVMGQRIFQEFKDKGLAQFSRSDIPPAGFARIDDRVANVIEYRPTTKASGAPGAPERVLRGHWFVQEDAARVLNNFLSPGLDRYKWFRAIRWIGNTMNMAQLGLSGYHFTFTMIDSGTSKLSLGMEQLAKGELKAGGAKSAQGLVPAVNQLEYYIRGSKVLQEYTKPGSVGAEYAKIVDALLASGGRVEMPRIFRNNSLENFFKAARTGNYPGAIVRAPFAAIEAVSHPLMQNIVPRLKLGVFSDMALAEIEKMGPNVARDEYRARLGKIWDSVDNRMGEMVYDNLFWNRNLKDLSFLAVRAVGWNLGTIRELGGGVMDAATVISRVRKGDPLVTRRMAYVVALPVTVGIMGAMYQYAKTGQGPQEMRDYFYPKTGKMLPDGTPERVNFPSYLKDIASYGMHPFKTLTNKLHPLWSEMAQMLDNKDYYGQQIRNPDDPLVKQVQEELAFVAKNFVPFSVRGAERRAGAKESKEIKAESFFGVMPISPEIARTPAQNKIMEYSRIKAPVGGRTPEEQQRSEFTRDIESQLQGPQDYAKTQQALIQAQREGKLTRSQRLYQLNKLRFERLEMGRGHSKAQAQWLWRFEHLPVDQAQHVYDISTPVEKQLFKRALDLKVRRARQPQTTE